MQQNKSHKNVCTQHDFIENKGNEENKIEILKTKWKFLLSLLLSLERVSKQFAEPHEIQVKT